MNLFPKKRPDDKPPAFTPSAAGGKPPADDQKGGAVAPATPLANPSGSNAFIRTRGFLAKNTLMERVKTLRRKDLAFIVAGLAVLIMAPLAEFLMMNPSDSEKALKEGFAERGAAFPDGTTPYEEGVSGIAPGGLVGRDNDVITPLNVRNPADLVLGPGATEKPAAPPPQAPAKQPPADWKDALDQAAKQGAERAVRRAPGLPRPDVKLAGALRGLSAVSGASSGGGPQFRLEAPTSRGLFGNPQAGSSFTRVQPIPGYRGGMRSLASGSGGEGGRYGLPGAAGGAGSALEALPGGGFSGFGSTDGRQGSGGDETKSPGGSNTKDNRSTSAGENLALLRAKLELEKAIGLKWDKKRYRELDRRKMIEQIAVQTAAQTAQQAFMEILKALLAGKKDGGAGGGGGGGGDPGGKPADKPAEKPAPRTEQPPADVPGPGDGAPANAGEPDKILTARNNSDAAADEAVKSAAAFTAAKASLNMQIGAGAPTTDAAIKDMQTKLLAAKQAPDLNASALKGGVSEADKSIKALKQAADGEKARMESEAGDGASTAKAVGEFKTDKKTFTVPPKIQDRIAFDGLPAPQAAKVEPSVKAAEALAAASKTNGEAAAAALKAVEAAEKTLQDKKFQMSDDLKKSFAAYKSGLETMVKAAGETGKQSDVYAANMSAVGKISAAAGAAYGTQLKENDEKVVKALTDLQTKAVDLQKRWTGPYKPEVEKERDTLKADLDKLTELAKTRKDLGKTDIINKFVE